MNTGGILKAPLRVIVAEDNRVVRQLICGIIRQDPNLELVGEASDGAAALELVKTLKPNALCLDLIMPGMDGMTALRQIQVDYPQVRVIIISGDSTAEAVSQARSLGCSAFVVKPFTAAKVLGAIYSASRKADSSPPTGAAEG
jgi:two-component system chemotaxis response regulator CheY